jgi:hypothetical protein
MLLDGIVLLVLVVGEQLGDIAWGLKSSNN